jgi:hypothetical protein
MCIYITTIYKLGRFTVPFKLLVNGQPFPEVTLYKLNIIKVDV